MPADGKGIYVDPGTEPVDHTEGAEPDEIEDEPEIEVDEEAPKPGDADYVDPDAEDDDDEETPPVTLPKEAADALAFQKYLGTKDGAVDFLIEAGLGLGKSVDELEAFFMGKPPVEEDDEDDDDGVMTRAEYRAEQAKRDAAAEEQRQQDRLVEQAKVIQGVAIEKLQSYKVGDEDLSEKQRQVVANFADTYLDEDTQYDPQAVAAALDQGFKDFTEAMGFTVEGKKVVKRKVVPKGLKGSTGGASEEAEPQNLEEAFKRARAKLKEQGEI